MNEKAILDSYNLFKGGGYNGSLEDYKNLLNTNENAVKDSYKLFKGGGYNGEQGDFEVLLGVKKKVTSEPISTDQELDSTSILGGRLTPVVTGEVEELDVITPAVEVKSSNSYMSDLLVKAQNPERADKYKEKLNYKSDNPVYVDGKVDLIEDPVLKQKLSEDYNIQGALKIGVINQEDVDLALKGDIDSIKKIQEISTLSNKEINDKIKTKRLDVPYAYETFSDLQANIGFEGSVIDSMYDGNELSKIDGFNIIDFDGRLKERGYQEKYQQLLAGEVVSEEGVDVSFAGTQNPNLAAERLKLQYLNEYLGHQLQRDYDFQVLDYKSKNNGHHPALDGVEINPTSGIDKNALTKYIEKSFPIVTAKLKNQDIKNQEIYQQHKNGDIRFFEDLMKQGWRSLEDRINNFSSSTYDMIGMDNVAEGIRMGKAETAMGRTGLLRYTFASGKQADVGGTQYLVDENNQIYDVDRKIAVSEVLNPFEAKKIIETVNDIGEKNWSISPTGGAVATAGIVTDMVAQIALTRGVGVLGQGVKAAILSKAGSKLPFLGGGVKFLEKIPIKATTASAMIAQGTLFSSNLYEQARVQAIDAGLTVQQADEMAAMAGRQGFVLGFFTAPLSTQTYAMNKVFGSGPSEKLIKNATDAYLKGGSKAALGVWQKAQQKVSKYAPIYLREGGKETIQENIQQVGQTYGIGSNVNEAAGVDVMKQNITMDEVINTTALSFIAGMIMPMGGDVFSSRRKTTPGMDAIEKLKSLDILSKDPEKTRELLNSQVNKGVYTEDQVENILADIEMYRTSINSIPTNLSAEISLSVMPDISKINKLKNLKESQEPAFHPAIDKKIAELRNSIVKKTNFDELSNKAKEDLKNKAMNELLNESEERGETDVELNDNVIIERAIENFSTQEVVEVEDTAEVKDESVVEETVEDQGTEERYKDSQIPVSKQTFTVENDGDETITVEVTTQLDGSRKVVQKLDDGSVAGSEKISKDNTLTNEDYVSKAYGDVKKTEDVDIKTVINPNLESKMSDRQRDAAGFPTLKPKDGFTTKREKQPQIIPVKGSRTVAVQVDPEGKVVAINKKTGKPLEKAPPAKVQKIILRDIIDVNEGTRLEISEDTNLTPEQYNSEVAENSNNIKEISETIEIERIRLKEQTKSEKEVEADPLGILDLVSNITEQQFIDASDIANVTNNMKRYWFKKPETNVLGDLIPDTKAFGLDTLVKDLDGYTQENASEYIQKVVDFIIKNDTANLKIKTGKSPGLIDLEIKFEALTGLKPTPTNIQTVLDIDPTREPISSLKKTQKEQYQREASEPGVFSKNKKGPSAKSIVSRKPKKINNVDEAAALKDQIRLEIKAANDSKKDQTIRRKALGDAIKSLKKAGKITTNKMNTLIGKVTGVNLNNSKSIAQVLSYVEKVNNDANATKKNADAKIKRKSIKRKLNEDTEGEVSLAVKRFLEIDVDLVSDLDAYSSQADNIIEGLTKSKKTKDGGIDIKGAVDIKSLDKYTIKAKKDQDIKIKEAEAQTFMDVTGLSSDQLTIEQMRDILNNKESESKADEKGENIPGVKAEMVSEAAKKAFETYKSIINSIIRKKVDPFTGESINLSINQEILIKSFMDIDLDLLTTNEKLLAIDSLINFAANQGTGGMAKLVDRVKGIKGVKKAKRQGLKAVPLKLYFSKKIGTFWNDYIVQLPTTFESMFKGQSQALIFQDLSGFNRLRRGAAKAEKITNNIADAYHKKFIKGRAKPNGEVFNSLDNDIERGMLSNIRRTVDGTKEEQANEFDRRKGLIEQTIDRLEKEGETKKYEAYKRVYDKILKESKNVSDVESKVDRINKKAVEWFTDQWTKIRPELGDISLGYYNRVLESDINYTPDSMTKVDSEAGNTVKIGEPIFQGSRETIYDKETGVLMVKKPGYKLPSGRIVNLGFDSRNISSLKAALTDVYTAGPIQQLKGFTESSDFKDIVPNVSDRKLLLQRFNMYVDSKREVSQYNKNKAAGLKLINSLAGVGVSRVLGGPTQVPKQLVPIINTTINLVNDPVSVAKGLTLAVSNPDTNQWLNDSGYEIANRGIQSITNLEGTNSKLRIAAKGNLDKLSNTIIDLNKKYLELFLVAPDKFAARASWLAYYLNNLKKQGVTVEDGDWSKHTINEKAADFAQQQTSRQQNTSDSDLQGRLFSSRNSTQQLVRKVLFPFANFLLNQKARMFSDLGVLTSRSLNNEQDRVAAAKSLTGLVGETIAFNAMSLLITQLLAGLSGYITDDDSRRAKKKDLDNRIKGRLGNALLDVVSPMPPTDPIVMGAINGIIRTFSDEKDPWQFFNNDKKTLIEQMGVLGIPAKGVSELIEMVDMASTGTYTDKYGNKNRIRKKYQEDMAINTPIYFAYLAGLLPIEVGSVIRYNVKSYKRKSK